MTIENPFPPIQPIVPLPPPQIVVRRQRRNKEKTRKLLNLLDQEQKQLAEQEQKSRHENRASNKPSLSPPSPSGTEIDKLA
jgi:hypothetical protein